MQLHQLAPQEQAWIALVEEIMQQHTWGTLQNWLDHAFNDFRFLPKEVVATQYGKVFKMTKRALILSLHPDKLQSSVEVFPELESLGKAAREALEKCYAHTERQMQSSGMEIHDGPPSTCAGRFRCGENSAVGAVGSAD